MCSIFSDTIPRGKYNVEIVSFPAYSRYTDHEFKILYNLLRKVSDTSIHVAPGCCFSVTSSDVTSHH